MSADTGTSLGDELPRQQARCRKLLVIYRSIGPVGTFGALMIEQALARADQAVMSSDVVAMLRSCTELSEFKE